MCGELLHLQCTLSMVKALVFKGPRGYNLVAEFDYIYPLPDTVQSLKPKKTNLKAVPPPPPPPPTTTEAIPTFIDDHENHIFYDHPEFSEHHPDVFAPNSGWRVDPNFADLPDVPAGKEIPDGLASDRTWLSQSTVSYKLLFHVILLFKHFLCFRTTTQKWHSNREFQLLGIGTTQVHHHWDTAQSKHLNDKDNSSGILKEEH